MILRLTKLGGFQSQFQASCVSRHTEELWYNETVPQLCPYNTLTVIPSPKKDVFSKSRLNIDRKIPLTCHISCMGGITRYSPVSQSNQNTGISSAEVSPKLRWWQASQEAQPRRFGGRPENYISQGSLQPRQSKQKRQRRFTDKPHRPPCVSISAISDSLLLYPYVHLR